MKVIIFISRLKRLPTFLFISGFSFLRKYYDYGDYEMKTTGMMITMKQAGKKRKKEEEKEEEKERKRKRKKERRRERKKEEEKEEDLRMKSKYLKKRRK